MNKIIYFCTFLALLFISCDKSKITPNRTIDNTNIIVSIPLIHTETHIEGDQVRVDTFYYDKLNRVCSIKSNNGDVWTADYSKENIFIANYKKQNGNKFSVEYILNEKGYFVKKGSIKDSAFYDINGFLLMNKNEKLFVQNGNIMCRTFNNYKTEYDYDLSKLNTIGNYNSGWLIEGNDNVNLIVREKKIILDKLSNEVGYLYEFDSFNRVSKKTAVQYEDGIKSNIIEIISYTYY